MCKLCSSIHKNENGCCSRCNAIALSSSIYICAFGRVFNVSSVFCGVKNSIMSYFGWDRLLKSNEEIVFPYLSDGLQFLEGKVIGIHKSLYGQLICIQNNKARSEIKWDHVYLWQSYCGGESGILALWDKSTQLEMRRTKGDSGFDFSRHCNGNGKANRLAYAQTYVLGDITGRCSETHDCVGSKFVE